MRQAKVIEMAARDRLTLVCGRYEGVDDRIRHFVDEEVSLGDFVLVRGRGSRHGHRRRLRPATSRGAWERCVPRARIPQHGPRAVCWNTLNTRARWIFRGLVIPEVLTSGNHATIAAYRMAEAERRTRERRPDLWDAALRSREPAEGGP